MTTLDTLATNACTTVMALRLTPREAAWLRAVGLAEGARVTLLRRAPFKGPLHVRIDGGTELAIDFGLARSIDVSPPAPEPA